MSLKQSMLLNLKNIPGWRTKRKIIVFSVDDYGNVRVDSKEARERMDKAGVKAQNRFDRLDTLETRQDLEMLYETLRSVKDSDGNHAVFTTFALSCNINFEKMQEEGYKEYQYELLPETYEKLSLQQQESFKGAWSTLQHGIKEGLIVPQFHGREHLNLKVFDEMLQKKEPALIGALHNRSYTGFLDSGYNTTSPMAAFDFWEFSENNRFEEIIEDGLNKFEEVYGYRADHFTPPVYNAHPITYESLRTNGVKYVDNALIKQEHQGEGSFKKRFNYTGKVVNGLTVIVRNVVFEPTDQRGFNWVDSTMQQIEAAFRWNKPAIISSHRVNFCGHIDPMNRKMGLAALRELLKRITEKWPEVVFMAANELGDLVSRRSET